MGKQNKSRKLDNIGKGKVTPVQIAFIVDRYLADNNFNNTRTNFRNEASDLISRSPIQEAPRSLLSLEAIFDEYISLKGQKVMLDQEKRCLEQEKLRVQTLLKGMQDVMNGYNTSTAALPLPMVSKSVALVPHVDPTVGSSSGFPVYHNSVVMSSSRPINNTANSQNFSTPVVNVSSSKRRRGSKDVSVASVAAKRSRYQSATKYPPAKDLNTTTQQSNIPNGTLQHSMVEASSVINVPTGSQVQGSSVAKRLFNQHSQSLPTNSSCPSTPPRVTSSPTEKSVSSPEVTNAPSSNNVTPQQMNSANCTVIASETITVSPAKQAGYYSIQRNCSISTSSPMKTNMKRCFTARDNVKGRLDFDGPGIIMNTDKPVASEVMASETGTGVDCFDFDLPNLDVFGPDFCFSELLSEFDIDCEGTSYAYQTDVTPSPESLSGSPNTSDNNINGSNQVLSELSSTVTEIISEKNMNTPGPDSVTSVKSVTKSITILSPVKNQRSPSQNQERISATT